MIKYGVMGVGHLGRFHAMQAKEVKNCELVGVFDSNITRAEEIANEFSIKAFKTSAEFYDAIDAFSLVTVTPSHFQLAKEAIQLDKHILIEKPITRTVEEADELIDLAKRHKVKLQVGHIERFNSALMGLKNIELEPYFIESHRLSTFNVRGSDVEVVLDLMIHDIDLILTLVRSKVTSVKASGISIVSSSEDLVNCRLEFENGCVANITASRISANAMRKMRIFQKDSYLSLDFQQGSSDIYFIKSDKTKSLSGDFALTLGKIEEGSNAKEIRYVKHNKLNINPLRVEIENFVNAIENDTQPLVTAEDGREALRIAKLIMKEVHLYQEKIGVI